MSTQTNSTANLTDRFGRILAERDARPATVRAYLCDLRGFARWFAGVHGEFDPAAVTPLDLVDYRGWLQRHGRKPKSVNRALVALKVFLEWCAEEGLCQGNAAAAIRKVEEVAGRPRWLSRRDQAAFVRAVQKHGNPRDRAIVALLLHAGLRVGELTALDHSHLMIRDRSGQVTVTGKGNKVRRVPLNVTARTVLREYLDGLPPGEGPLFLGRTGSRLTARSVERLVGRYAYLAHLEDVTPHTLRHCFVKNLVDAGIDLPTVAALAGHASLDVTRLYCLPGEQDLALAVERVAWE